MKKLEVVDEPEKLFFCVDVGFISYQVVTAKPLSASESVILACEVVSTQSIIFLIEATGEDCVRFLAEFNLNDEISLEL